VQAAKDQSLDKSDLLKFVLEQIFGKARQSIGLDGGEEGKPILYSEIAIKLAKKYTDDSIQPVA